MSRYNDYMRLASEARLLSPMKVKVGAVLVKGGRVIKIASNMPGGRVDRRSTQGLVQSTNTSAKYLSQWSRHAEVRATLNVDARGGTIYVYRGHGLTGAPMMARPCPSCEEWLNYVGVSKCYYTGQNVSWRGYSSPR